MASPAPAGKVHTLRLPLPHTANRTHIHIHLTIHANHLLVFLTTREGGASGEGTAGATEVGSFVYALPAVPFADGKKREPLSTPLYVRNDTVDTATRLAKILVSRTGRPVYLGNSMRFGSAGRGGDVDEEMEAVAKVVEGIVGRVKEADKEKEKWEVVEKGVEGVKIAA